MDEYVFRRLNANLHLIAVNTQNSDENIVTNIDGLACAAG
jgi:hypothetical protein